MNTLKKLVTSLLLVLFSTQAFAITNTDLFAWAAAAYPQYFPGTPTAGVYPPYNYQLYSSGNYLAVDNTGGVYVLGPVSGNQILNVGTLTSFTPLVTAWETKLCTSPQVYSNGACATPTTSLPAGYVSQGGLIWMPVSSTQYTYAQASALCAGTINGQSGWRLPTQPELSALYAAYPINSSSRLQGQGWTVGLTWSSTTWSNPGTPGMFGMGGTSGHTSVDLNIGMVNSFFSDTSPGFVTCVNSATPAGLTAQSIGTLAFSPATLAVGGTTTVSATASSGLAVSFSSTTPSICTVSGSTVTAVAAGACTIAADQAGNATYNSALHITQTFQVLQSNGLPAGYVSQGGLTWTALSSTMYNNYTDAQASALCAGTINGQTGWRLPTGGELSALSTSGQWVFGLAPVFALPWNNNMSAFVTCVR